MLFLKTFCLCKRVVFFTNFISCNGKRFSDLFTFMYFCSLKAAGNSISIHPNGVSVAVAMNSGSVRVYDIRALNLQQHYILHDDTRCVAWHPRANYLLTCGKDGNVIIVDAIEGRPFYTLKSHESSVEHVTFSADGEHFASGGADKLVMVTNFAYLRSNLTKCNKSLFGHIKFKHYLIILLLQHIHGRCLI